MGNDAEPAAGEWNGRFDAVAIVTILKAVHDPSFPYFGESAALCLDRGRRDVCDAAGGGGSAGDARRDPRPVGQRISVEPGDGVVGRIDQHFSVRAGWSLRRGAVPTLWSAARD